MRKGAHPQITGWLCKLCATYVPDPRVLTPIKCPKCGNEDNAKFTPATGRLDF